MSEMIEGNYVCTRVSLFVLPFWLVRANQHQVQVQVQVNVIL